LNEAILVSLFNEHQDLDFDLITKKISTIAKQAFDLAMLSQGLLTGKDLTAFLKRSVEMI
jgi:hypothetical protein